MQTEKTAFGPLHRWCKYFQKRFGRRMTPAEILCWRYSYVELMWELILSRNAKMKRETDLGLCEMPSRRTKPIKIFWKRQNEAGNRSKSPKSHFLRRETRKILRKVISRGGKGEKCLGKRLRAAGRRLKIPEIDFPPQEMGLFLRKTFSAAESPPTQTSLHTTRCRAKKVASRNRVSFRLQLFRDLMATLPTVRTKGGR